MDIIADMRSDCPCCQIAYCPMAEIIRHMSERMLVQHKCIEVDKWQRGQVEGRIIGWQEAYQLWADSGQAARFAAAWHVGMTHDEVLETMLKGE